MSSVAPATLGQLIGAARLTPAQRSVAHYILDHQGEIALLSSPALAERVGVSQPSVARFVTAVGFDSYAGFQKAVALHTVEAPLDGSINLYERSVRSAATHLDALADSLRDSSQIEQIGSLLSETPVLPVVGFRTAAGVATSFVSFASKLHNDVRQLTEGSSAMLDVLLAATSAGATWALAFVLPRYPRESIEAMQFLKQQGCKLVVVTDHALSPAARLADELLLTPVSSDLIFDSYVAPSMVGNLLLEALADANPAQSQERLEAFDEVAASHSLFVD